MTNTTIAAVTSSADDQLVPAVVLSAEATKLVVVDDEPAARVAVPSRLNHRGMVSAEWAVGIIAAIAIAGVLLSIVTSGPVHALLLKEILKIIASITKGM